MATAIITVKSGISNSFLIGDQTRILVDTGVPGKIDLFKKVFRIHQIDPGSVSLIVLTHTHRDHIGSVHELAEFTGAKLLVHRAEKERLESGRIVIPQGITPWGRFLEKILILKMKSNPANRCQVDIVMGDDDFPLSDFGIPGRILFTPGHSPGSLSVILENGSTFVGDMAMNNFPLRFSPGIPVFAEMPEKIDESWDRIIEAGAKIVYPAHGKRFPLDKLNRDLRKM